MFRQAHMLPTDTCNVMRSTVCKQAALHLGHLRTQPTITEYFLIIKGVNASFCAL